MVGRIDYRSPLHHFVNLFAPGGSAQTLLHDDASLVAFRAGGHSFVMHRATGQFLTQGRLRRSGRLRPDLARAE